MQLHNDVADDEVHRLDESAPLESNSAADTATFQRERDPGTFDGVISPKSTAV